ncbi:MAG: ABC transporter ATP-binding protein [Deltaproteobacteria bacterium]|nr:MAG: ABC transporter ATP-binding protein [Deltaproteobacteria bacterium]
MRTDFGYFEEKKLGKPYDMKLLKRLYPFIRPYKPLIFWSILLVVAITFLDLSIPYVTKTAIDRYIVPQIDRGINDPNNRTEIGGRYIQVDLTAPEIRETVKKYYQWFDINGDVARIPYDKLSQLDREDLTRLRRQDFAGLTFISIIFLMIILINFGLNFVQRVIMEYTGHVVMHDLRMNLFEHIQSLPIEFFIRNPVGRLVTRVTNDVQNMHELFTSIISFIFKDLFLLFGIAAVLLSLNWKLALLCFTVLPFVFYASSIFASRARDVFRLLRVKIAEINTRFSETISGIKVVQLFRHEKQNFLEFEKLNHENYLAGMQQIRILGIFLPFIEVLGVVVLSIVILYGGSGILAGVLSLGALVAFISYMKMFFRPIRDLAEKYNILQNAMASAERLFLILDTEDKLTHPLFSMANKPNDLQMIEEISLEDVSFSYIAGEMVLEKISLNVRAGETIAVVGPTGAGKTSLINLIMRFYDPTGGRVLINGRNIKYCPPSAFRAKMALVMQEPFLFSESVRNNIFRDIGDVSDQELAAILEASNCKSLTDRLPQGPDTVLSEGGSSISSGERQLISIARAFARNPQVILFDEATSYIDSQTEIQIQEALEKLMKRRTAFIVAHRLSTIRKADRIIVLNRGRIIESGSHDELMDKEGFYYQLNQIQN